MREAELQKAVIELARTLGWYVAHFKASMTPKRTWATAVQGDGKGFPDLVLVRRDRLLFVELKMDGKYPKPEQKIWMELLKETSAEVYLWRPKDYLSEQIKEILL